MKSNKVVVVEYFMMSMSPLSLRSFVSSAGMILQILSEL